MRRLIRLDLNTPDEICLMRKSGFLDAYGAGLATEQQFEEMRTALTAERVEIILNPLFNGLQVAEAEPGQNVVVGLVLARANSAEPLLKDNWAARQAVVQDQSSTWSTYGADAAAYNSIKAALQSISASAGEVAGYESSIENRTIWVQLDGSQFKQLFGTNLLSMTYDQNPSAFTWAGELNLDSSSFDGIMGVWFEQEVFIENPQPLNTTGVELVGPLGPDDTGPLSTGNATAAVTNAMPTALPGAYNFPLDATYSTPAIALVEAVVPVTPTGTLADYYNQYRTEIGLPEAPQSDLVIALGATDTPFDPTSQAMAGNVGEMALDISVVAGAAPMSTQLLYQYQGGTPFNAYQQAFFATDNPAPVLSSSYAFGSQPTRDSPFQWAFEQLMVDGALNNISTHIAAGDSGSTANHYTGVANLNYSLTATTALIVGGTSIASLAAAQQDPTLTTQASQALNGDRATIFALVASGLRTLPANLPDASSSPSTTLVAMFESVWNGYTVEAYDGFLNVGLGGHNSGTGGVNTDLPIPDYQLAFGLQPKSTSGPGRGVPDVSMLAGGDTQYANLDSKLIYAQTAPTGNLYNPEGSGGTSAATPLWASLTARFDAIFADHELPNLGFYNDLIYSAAAVAPASFNDISVGNNIDSFVYGSFDDYRLPGGDEIIPTGDGYTAGYGYDLASGLGSPNGVVLARTLATIAHTQTNELAGAPSNPVISMADAVNGFSTADQTLLVQGNYVGAAGITRLVEVLGLSPVEMTDNNSLGWTDRLAGQVVQGDNFDSALMPFLDGGAKSVPYQITVAAGDTLGVSVDGEVLSLYQQSLTNDYGFIRFGGIDGGITLARPVAIAETAGGVDGQEAVVRIRQNGGDHTQLEIYRVDDLNGGIDTGAGGVLMPGQAGYVATAAARDYQLVGGGTVIDGPGQTNFAQATITGVDEGDIVALKYSNVTTGETYWSFSQANTVSNTSAIFAYGLNTWGFEDRPLTGDHDYQDLVVQLDFTSSAGHGLLV